jgi:hypothetical protein
MEMFGFSSSQIAPPRNKLWFVSRTAKDCWNNTNSWLQLKLDVSEREMFKARRSHFDSLPKLLRKQV